MTFTVADLAAEMGQRLGPFSPLVNVSSVAAYVLRDMGLATVSALAVTTDELSTLDSSEANRFLDVATYEATERILANLDPVQLKQIGIDEDVKDVRKYLSDRAARLRTLVKDRYGYGTQAIVAGAVDMDYQARGDNETSDNW